MKKNLLVLILGVAVIFGACAELQKILVQETVANLAKCDFKLKGVRNFTLAGVPLSSLTSLSQLRLQDTLTLTQAFASGQLPTNFTLDLGVKNPNNGSNGLSTAAGLLSNFPWNLYINGKQTISGNIDKAVNLPANNEETIIPLGMNLNLAQFFKEDGYKPILDLAMAMGGKKGSASNLSLRAKPSIETKLGPINYPNEIDIISKEYSN